MRVFIQTINILSTNKTRYFIVLLLILLIGAQTATAAPADDFVTTWKTDNPGISNSTSITVPIVGGPYDVDWNNNGVFDQFNLTGSITHNYLVAGTYTIRIRGAYTSVDFGTNGDNEKILSLDQWGTKSWMSMLFAFYNAKNLKMLAVDIPDLSAVTNMRGMFRGATSANPDVSAWNTSTVTSMMEMFRGATSANPDVSGWDTSAVTNMDSMFSGTAFDQDIGSWDVTSLKFAEFMFNGSALSAANYESLLNGWNAQTLQSSVTFSAGNTNYCSAAAAAARANMIATYNWTITDGGQLCTPLDPSIAPDLAPSSDTGMFNSDDITTNSAPAFYVMCSAAGNTISLYTDNPSEHTLVAINACSASGIVLVFVTNPLVVGLHNISYTDKKVTLESGPSPLLAIIIEPQGPTDDFVTTWKTDNHGSSTDTSIIVPMQGGPYDVDWNNDGAFDEFGLNGSVTHDYMVAGIYTIRIQGVYDSIRLGDSGDEGKVLSLDQWGTNTWKTMNWAFASSVNLVVPATDTPNFSVITDMSYMFSGATLANPDTSGWDTSAVTDMSSMFTFAESANPDTSGWDTSSVMSMAVMFAAATTANPDTSSWDTSSVTTMSDMFAIATSANPDVSNWDTSAVKYMGQQFLGAISFNRDIGSWDIINLLDAGGMFAGVVLPSANYDSLLIGWNTQGLQPFVNFSGGNSKYCSAAAIAARANLISTYNWTITDGGQGCPVAPTTPTIAPDLTSVTDTGISDSDNITANSSPQFEVVCSAIGNSITLYTDNPFTNTVIGNLICTTVGAENVRATAVFALADGAHTISYIDQYIGERSGRSPSIVITVDTIAPSGPGSLTGPGSPINDVNVDIIGSCGADAANDTVVVTTSAPNGFTTLYNTPITLDGNGSFSIVDPNWSEGTFTVHFECSDAAGNTATLGPFGPILIDLSCSGVDTVVAGDFLAGMHLCAGTSSLVTSGNINLETGAIVYFQSPEITINPDFNVSEGASLIASSVVGTVAPLLLGPTQITASVGDIVVFSESYICEDYEDGVLAIMPLDTGVLAESAEPEVFILSCTDFDGKSTQKTVTVIRE